MQLGQQAGAHSITVTGLVPGNIYYILLDGYSGQNCGYTFVANDGIDMEGMSIITDQTTICLGESVNATVTGGAGNYTWTGEGLNTTTGSQVVITPPSIVGNYEYTVTSLGGDDFCPNSSDASVIIEVESCDDCVPPAVNITNLGFCDGNNIDLNEALPNDMSGFNFSFHSSEANAENNVNPIATVVNTPSTYWVRVSMKMIHHVIKFIK